MMVRLYSGCKCKYCFMAKMNVGMALVQGQMLARLHGKGSRYGYVAKNSWNDCVEKISVGTA